MLGCQFFNLVLGSRLQFFQIGLAGELFSAILAGRPSGFLGLSSSLSLLVFGTDPFEFGADLCDSGRIEFHPFGHSSARFVSADLEDQVGEFGVFNDLGEDVGLDRLHRDGGLVAARQLADPAQAAPHGRVEVVLDGVVGPEWEEQYLPTNNLEISFHLLPSLRWASNRISSSRLLQASWLMAGFRWLCHLRRRGSTFRGIACQCARWCCRGSASPRPASSFSCRTS